MYSPFGLEETEAEAKWKGLLARVEALAEFCRAEGLEAPRVASRLLPQG